jgi:hypothetical protein
MDLAPSVWLSTITGALLFFQGGKLWGKAASRRALPEPPARDDGAALARAERDAVTAQQASAASQSRLALAEERIEALRGELAVERTRVEVAAALGIENAALRREVEERRQGEARLADVQRQNIELATQAHLFERRRSEIEGKDAENEALRRDVARLSGEASEVEVLRAKVHDLTARGFALNVRTTGPAPKLARPKAGEKLEDVIAGRLDELRVRKGSCQTAVLADMRGLLLASCGDTTHDDALAAAASMIAETSERMRRILPLGEPLEIRLTDVNHAVFTARWLDEGQEKFLVSTLGVTREKADARAGAIEASIADLLRAPAPPSPHV